MKKVNSIDRQWKLKTGKKYDGMMRRCYNKIDPSFKNYGARGIRVAGAWITDINNYRTWFKTQLDNQGISVEEFIAAADQCQVDRIDVNGHYTPENCRIVTPQENSRNRRRNKYLAVSAEGDLFEV